MDEYCRYKGIAYWDRRSYNRRELKEILRGRVQIPTGGIVRDPLPQRHRLNWCNSSTDSKVWMREEIGAIISMILTPDILNPGFYFV